MDYVGVPEKSVEGQGAEALSRLADTEPLYVADSTLTCAPLVRRVFLPRHPPHGASAHA